MSMTKTQYWEEICTMTGDFDEAEYWLLPYQLVDETEFDWFSDFRLAHDGYSEFDEVTFSTDFSDDELPF